MYDIRESKIYKLARERPLLSKDNAENRLQTTMSFLKENGYTAFNISPDENKLIVIYDKETDVSVRGYTISEPWLTEIGMDDYIDEILGDTLDNWSKIVIRSQDPDNTLRNVMYRILGDICFNLEKNNLSEDETTFLEEILHRITYIISPESKVVFLHVGEKMESEGTMVRIYDLLGVE